MQPCIYNHSFNQKTVPFKLNDLTIKQKLATIFGNQDYFKTSLAFFVFLLLFGEITL